MSLKRLLGGLVLGWGLVALPAFATQTAEVYRDPSCGCCEAWIAYLKSHGFAPVVHDEAVMPAVKARLGVPDRAASCHTAVVGGYVIEGHVPVEDIRRLLAERPRARGLAAPGMPMGSPGMEMGPPQRYTVVLIGPDGSTRPFATHGPAT
ncbi:DUF411 domain-containing protein [Frateuria soli]|uniref:DUF411 domain-containing protein n=1 Tax=Frateuria soli TaxID=1542730 RepID=UPI001E348C26|nr:DUF411 domain-containing protein [Frateuria soli]UGB39813.1 DUF411 domain-containing protein [Frateuria soli]